MTQKKRSKNTLLFISPKMNENFSIPNNAIFREKEKLILFFLSIKNTL